MVSTKLIHQIEDHWEAVSQRWIRLLRAAHGLQHLNRLPESEAVETCRRVLHNLGHWLASSSREEMASNYEQAGRERCRSGMPLSEALRAIQLHKQATVSYIRDQGIFDTSVDLYAGEELEHDLSVFFDLLMYHMARGYEQEQEKGAHAGV